MGLIAGRLCTKTRKVFSFEKLKLIPAWHGWAHGWPQIGRISSQGWVHLDPSSWHSPTWQILLHLCPQGSSLPHSLPQETFFWKQGIDVRIILPQLHRFSISTGQGGHSASEWQLWWTLESFQILFQLLEDFLYPITASCSKAFASI